MAKIIVLLLCIAGSFPLQAEQTLNRIDIAQYQGKVVYLDFWASWCIPCRKSFPWLNKMRQKYSNQQLEIIGVNLDRDRALAEQFLQAYPAEFKIFFDPAANLAKQYQIPGMPSSIIFDKSGNVVSVHSGFFNKKIRDYKSQIEAAINQPLSKSSIQEPIDEN